MNHKRDKKGGEVKIERKRKEERGKKRGVERTEEKIGGNERDKNQLNSILRLVRKDEPAIFFP